MDNPFSHLQDDKLMELYQNGEEKAFEVIYLRHKNRVYSYINKRLHEKDSVDDVFQGIFIKFHKSRHLYKNDYPLLKWLYTICRSELLDFVKKKRATLIEFKDKYSEDPYEPQNEIDLDSEKSLSEKEKQALKLRYLLDEDFSHISTLLNTSEANSRKLVSRAIKKLRLTYLGTKNG